MQRYILRRLLISIPLVLGVTIISFVFIHLAPGDPVEALIDPVMRADLGPDWVAQRKEELGLNQPMPVRYAIWLGQLAQGNMGFSLVSRQPVGAQLQERIGPTLLLMGTSLLVAIVLGVPLGVLSAVRQYSLLDYLATIAGFVAISTPSFFLGLGLIYLVSVNLRLLPTSGMYTLGAERSLADLLAHLVLPVTVLGLGQTPQILRYTRSSVLEVLRQEYVTTARAKGLAERIVLLQHIIRNALIPLITVVGLSLPNLLGGAVITEQIFQWPGMGWLAVRAVNGRDYPLLMGVILVTATMVLLSNLLADILYASADPRIRYR
ncbi:MAG TPA: ABC transporter permease [Chloroflexota bacterium]|jgi:peptide/nickel transport system permease protein|nr:ABC transporter permease [Chloroflexota bacterium]